MTRNKTVLIVDDEYGARESLKIILDSDYNIITAASYDEALPLFGKKDIDLVLLDICMPGQSGLELLETLRQQGHTHRVIMVTAMHTLKTAVQAMKQGALDYITKPYDIEEIRAIVAENIQQKSPYQNNDSNEKEAFKAEHIIGYNTTLQPIFNLIHKLARTHSTVLITGESGTGKELIARAIHKASAKHDCPFIAVHLGAVSENLIESELFGHVRGAFTGADKDRKGAFEQADSGTLFLDEIGEIHEGIQVKLLRILQEKEYRAVGDNTLRHVKTRIIAATNQDLESLVEEKKFRQDLYYRLNVVPIHLPPLRERRQDIPLLTSALSQKIARRIGIPCPHFDDSIFKTMISYPWPGNIREMENMIENMLLLCDGDVLTSEDLPPALLKKSDIATEKIINENLLQSQERETIELALLQNNGVLTSTAKYLGTTRRILKYKMDKLGIEKSELFMN